MFYCDLDENIWYYCGSECCQEEVNTDSEDNTDCDSSDSSEEDTYWDVNVLSDVISGGEHYVVLVILSMDLYLGYSISRGGSVCW